MTIKRKDKARTMKIEGKVRRIIVRSSNKLHRRKVKRKATKNEKKILKQSQKTQRIS